MCSNAQENYRSQQILINHRTMVHCSHNKLLKSICDFKKKKPVLKLRLYAEMI